MRNIPSSLKLVPIIAALGFCTGISGQAHADIAYSVTELSELDVASKLNDNVEVVGQIYGDQTSDGWPHGAFWKNGTVTDLGMIGCRSTVSHCWSHAYGINNAGQIVGESFVSNSWPSLYFGPWAVYYAHEVIWQNENSAPALMRTLGWEYGKTLDINESGHAVGHGRSVDWTRVSGDYIVHGFVWRSDYDLSEIGQYGQYSKAFAINEAGQVTGEISVSGNNRAFLWQNESWQDLGHLGGGTSSGLDLNNNVNPQVVGYSSVIGGATHAFVWQNNVMTDLGTLPGASNSQANAINDAGDIVGESDNSAVIWQSGVMTNLNDEIDPSENIVLQDAIDINNNGHILIKGTHALSGGLRYYVLSPIGG